MEPTQVKPKESNLNSSLAPAMGIKKRLGLDFERGHKVLSTIEIKNTCEIAQNVKITASSHCHEYLKELKSLLDVSTAPNFTEFLKSEPKESSTIIRAIQKIYQINGTRSEVEQDLCKTFFDSTNRELNLYYKSHFFEENIKFNEMDLSITQHYHKSLLHCINSWKSFDIVNPRYELFTQDSQNLYDFNSLKFRYGLLACGILLISNSKAQYEEDHLTKNIESMVESLSLVLKIYKGEYVDINLGKKSTDEMDIKYTEERKIICQKLIDLGLQLLNDSKTKERILNENEKAHSLKLRNLNKKIGKLIEA